MKYDWSALERFDRIRAKIPPERRLPEDEALRVATQERAAMHAERDQSEGGPRVLWS
jgi:hypothetical protein